METLRPAIFLDRDGTIIEDQHYPKNPDLVEFVPTAKEALLEMQRRGYLLFVVSNQSGVGRGMITAKEFDAVHYQVAKLLADSGIEILQYAYCFHKPEDDCPCRKPNSELIVKMAQEFFLDLKASFTVGDKECDIELGRKVGATGVLVLSGKGRDTLGSVEFAAFEPRPLVVETLSEFALTLPAVAAR